MNRYMLILFENQNIYDDFSPEEMQKEIERHSGWIEELGDHYVSGEPLEKAAKTVRGKETVITDGPFVESKELVSGFYIIKAENLDEATKLAKGCPIFRLGGSAEVRQVMEMEMA